MLTGGETSDYKAVDELFALPVAKPKRMLADKGYDSDEVRFSLLVKGILPVIPPRSNRQEPIATDFRAYKDRNRIERMFNKLKQFRRIATDTTRPPPPISASSPSPPQSCGYPALSTGPSFALFPVRPLR